jgi:hypothetical protein
VHIKERKKKCKDGRRKENHEKRRLIDLIV